ncbi:hypothetical protein EDD35_7823 [Amycolatopsis thermoflava]|uniref:Uncharacterized protein n=1 Tax=Amycolatopsis thermoflava TaxID=84480 RepID=A0A3N2G6P8_9PSEU|nr:hypothetical protein EDD35_7823 [Amycolatopsis thermoflava]
MSELASESSNTMPADVVTLPRLAASVEEAA